jgi:nitroreductase
VSDQSFFQFCRGLYRILAGRPRVPRSARNNQELAMILGRRSVREFKPEAIPDETWGAVLEAARVAPSTVNLQTWSFANFTAEAWREFFGSPLPFGAARGLVVLADCRRARRAVPEFPYAPLCEHTIGVMNASLAAQNMTLAAEALGLASVMLSETGRTGFYDAKYLAAKLDLPAGVVPIMSIVFGWPAGNPPMMPPKYPLGTIAFSGPYRDAPEGEIEDWREQMQAGYRAAHKGERFSAKIAYYNRRIADAEKDLNELVFYEGSATDP